ncbi:LOW QUALITY PROTEIN: pro-FMRFamide-related neuropeptide FF [Pseudopipra pipra]|uniref:LOW QUALITY PROTEIN: pro-FMRFamide-related neuropeptide FF n=1 Tax=Pseudopipra pipra TaxID=415032 RepID=UPI00313962CE
MAGAMAGTMTGRPALLLMLLLLAGTPRSARCCPGTLDPAPVSPGPAAPSERGVRFGTGEARDDWRGGSHSGSGTAVTPGPPPAQAAAAAAPPGPPPAAAALGALLRSLQRPGRAPGTLLQPQRSGWGPQGGARARLSPRSWDPPLAPFWTMATPQRFGRRR